MYQTNKKATTNCIGIEYLQNAFEPEEIEELENNLNKFGIELKTYSSAPKYIMGIEELFPQIQIFLSSDIAQAIYLGIASSAIWDGIKLFFCSLKNIVKKKPFTHVSNNKVNTKATPNIHVNIGESHIVLPIDIDDSKFEYFVDKMFDSMDKNIVVEEKYVFYDAEKQTLEYYTRHEVAMKSYQDWKEKQNSKETTTEE